MASSTNLKGLVLDNLVKALPDDFMVVIKTGKDTNEREVLRAIKWVIPYKDIYYKYMYDDVRAFSTDFYNTTMTINLRS